MYPSISSPLQHQHKETINRYFPDGTLNPSQTTPRSFNTTIFNAISTSCRSFLPIFALRRISNPFLEVWRRSNAAMSYFASFSNLAIGFSHRMDSSHRHRLHQSADPPQDGREQMPGYRHLRRLETGVAGMFDDFCSDLDQPDL